MDSKSTSREFPGFSNLYDFGDTGTSAQYRGKFRFRGAREILRGELHFEHPVHVHWSMGRPRPEEVIWVADAIVLSSRLINLLNESRLTGWTTYPVEVFDKKGLREDGYAGLTITGRCGPIDNSKSQIVLKKLPAGKFPRRQGYFFEPSSWDGSDLFLPSTELDYRLFVTAPVRDVFRHAKIKNVHFERLDEAVRPIPPRELPHLSPK